MDTLLRKHQPLDRAAFDKMFLDNGFHIFRFDKPVPDLLRINNNRRSMLALAQAARLVNANPVL